MSVCKNLAEWLERLTANAVVTTVLGSIPASSDTVESEGRQMKQCWISYIKKEKNLKKFPSKECYFQYFQYFQYLVFGLLLRKWNLFLEMWHKNRPLWQQSDQASLSSWVCPPSHILVFSVCRIFWWTAIGKPVFFFIFFLFHYSCQLQTQASV